MNSETENLYRPWQIFLLSMILPGLGHIRLGQWARGLSILLTVILIATPMPALLLLSSDATWAPLIVVATLTIVVFLWLMGAWRAARAAQNRLQRKQPKWRTMLFYPVIICLVYFLWLDLFTGYIRANWMESFYISGNGMAPTIVKGDTIIADKRANCLGCPNGLERGDIVVFSSPENSDVKLIKRIAAMPGDEIPINGDSIDDNSGSIGDDKTKITVPSDHLYLLGDNPSASRDSRHFGPISINRVRGKARSIWMSYVADQGFRFERAGTSLLNDGTPMQR